MLSSDLLSICAKKQQFINEKPKPKYNIQLNQIKRLIKGHGTEAFKKSKGFFRASKCGSL